jgi:hypothetical protein
MALVQIVPAEVRVRCGSGGQPREIQVGRDRLRVAAIDAVRDERAAYPRSEGPRTIYLVRADGWRVRLTFHHRERRWLVEALDPRPLPLTAAA